MKQQQEHLFSNDKLNIHLVRCLKLIRKTGSHFLILLINIFLRLHGCYFFMSVLAGLKQASKFVRVHTYHKHQFYPIG